MPLPAKRKTARSIREARGYSFSGALADKRSSPTGAPLYLLDGLPLPSTMPVILKQILQTAETALLHLETLEQAAFDCSRDPIEQFHLLSAVLCVNRAIGEGQKEFKAAKALYEITKTPDTLLYKACALRLHSRNEEALELIERAERMLVAGFPATKTAGDIANVKYFLLLQLGRWSEAYSLQKKLGLHAYKTGDGTPIQRPWDGKQTDEPVAILLECAYGDFFFFGRLLPLIQKISPRAFLYVPSDLDIFSPDVESLLLQQKLDVRRHCSPNTLMTTAAFLSEILNLTPDGDWSQEIPAFKADPKLVEKFSYLRSDDKPTVGLCWRAKGTTPGVVGKEISFDFYRSLTPELASQIVAETPHIRWINLQYGEVLEGTEDPRLNDWQETAAVIENLDGVVSVDTGVMNLAASMGKSVYVLLGGLVDQKFADRNDKCPYYPSTKLFRNEGFGYDRAIAKVIRDLKRLVKP